MDEKKTSDPWAIPGSGENQDATSADAYDATQRHEVKKGETLWKIAEQYYGDGNLYPKIFEANRDIKSRVDILSQAKKLPAGMTADSLAAAKSGLAEITAQWTAATEASKSGNLMDAIAKAAAVKKKAAEVLTTLNMPVPEALKS